MDTSKLLKKIIDEEAFEQITLDELTTIDFSIITTTNTIMRWNPAGDSVVYDPKKSFVLAYIESEGLRAVMAFGGELQNMNPETQVSDLAQMQAFVVAYDLTPLYELVTF